MRIVAMCMLLACAGTIGCGDGKPDAKVANVKPGPMPDQGEWEGVYYDILFGDLHLEGDDSSVKGRWQRPLKAQWGKLEGKADGNVMRFSWEEYVDGLAGPNSKKKGKGYFVYTRPAGDNVDDVLDGEIGRGENEVGIEWHAIKQRNVKPNLASIGGQGSGEVGGGDWDSGNKEDEEPEEPEEPDTEDAPEL